MPKEMVKRETMRKVPRLWRDMDRMFADSFGSRLRWTMKPWEGGVVPRVDISETPEQMMIKAELPGIDPKEVNISLTGNILTIKGEKKSKREKKEDYLLVERSYGFFSRSLVLPTAVNADKIKATYETGVLTIICPKGITLPDGTNLTLRPMTRDDQYALYKFFISLGAEDRRFLRNDVTDRKVIEKWARNLNYDQVLPILAEYEGRIVANATLHYQTLGWGGHVAEVRVTIAPEFQGRRLGAALLEEITRLAAQNKVKKLLARVAIPREGVIRTFERAGFRQLMVLKNYVKDPKSQQYADIVLLVKELQQDTQSNAVAPIIQNEEIWHSI
jgi:HSP20 family protein